MRNQIFCENCLDTMRNRMSDECINLVVTSPPYDDLRNYHGYSFPFEDIAKELYRVMMPGGVIVWVVGDSIIKGSESGNSFRQALFFQECGFNIHDTMIYKKTGMRFPEKKRYAQIFEYMFVLSKGIPSKVHIIKDRPNRWAGYTNWGANSVRLKSGELKDIKDCKRYKKYGARHNIWEYNNGYGFGTKDSKAYSHPATFPEQLAEDHIITWSDEGDLVYDPFMGSGTTAKMAILTNRDYVGSEISSEFHKGALARIDGLENCRGQRLAEINQEEAKRLAEEEDHTTAIKESEKLAGGKKWQPGMPVKAPKDDSQPEVDPDAAKLRDAIFGSETE